MGKDGWDFFVSYTQADRGWAEWISWQLESAAYKVLIQEWDFVPGTHWTARMNDGLTRADRMIAVLSGAYIRSIYGQTEWQAAFNADPEGLERKLIPIRVEECGRPGLLGQVVSFDLFGQTVDDARSLLLDRIGVALSGTGTTVVRAHVPREQT